MTRVNNRKIMHGLAVRELKTNRKMSVVVVVSIILTCVLFTALTSIGGGLLSGTQQETMRQVGGDSMAGLKYVLPEDYEKVKEDGATRDVCYRIIVGQAVNDDLKNISVEVNCAGNEKAAEATFCMPTEGKLPDEYDEIAVSTIVLDELNIPHEIGTTVPIVLDIDGEQSEHVFRLCGFWQGEKIAMAQQCWVSRAFADENAPTPNESFYTREFSGYAGYWQVDFNYGNSWDIEGKTDKLLERLYGDSDVVPKTGVNWAYSTSTVDFTTLAGGILLVLMVFAAGYLIIYNIFHINISANIRKYGLLKTIGTTSKQIKRMVKNQAAIYSVIGIPAGLIIGVLLGKVMMISIMKTLNIYSVESYTINLKLTILICLVSAVFTFATVMISCRKPCRVAGNVSPIEALRYNDIEIKAKKEKKTARISPFSIARSNMSRSRKKTAVVVLSLTLSMVLLNTLVTLLSGFDMDKFVSNLIVGDFVVSNDKSYGYDPDNYFRVEPDVTRQIAGIDGVTEVSPIYYEYGELDIRDRQAEKLRALYEKYKDTDKYGELKEANESGVVYADIYGIPEDVLNLLNPVRGEIDREKFRSGKYAIVFTGYVGIDDEKNTDDDLYEPGDTLMLSANENRKEYEVMAVCDIPYALSTQAYMFIYGHVLIPESEYFTITDNRNAMSVVAMASNDSYDEVDRQIHLITDTGDSRLMVKSKQDYLDEYGDFVGMMKLVGGTLASILALIGILNFINAVVTGIFSRKRELAMMNAVGMAGSQIKKMLMWEGVYYAVLTTICSACFATLLSNVVINRVAGESPFFSYSFTLAPIGICVPILILMSLLIPLVSYQTICRESIVDRIREN